jgi:glycosyltransferase involved in cell wall biosynthesis
VTQLHVAIDCRVVDRHYPGIGRAIGETVRSIVGAGSGARITLLYGPGRPPESLAALSGSGVDLVCVGAAPRAPADQWMLPRLLRRLGADVFHAPYYAVPLSLPIPTVVTIYDLIPRLFPEYWPNPITRGVINTWTWYALRRAGAIIACSRATAGDVARLMPGTAGKVRVVPLGVAPRPAVTARAVAPAPYLLYVGSNKPHKNLPRLVRAFQCVAEQGPGRLVVAGAWDARYPEARDEARRLGLDERVSFEHFPSDDRLAQLYAGACGFVFPSLYEGFGLPVLEAMAAGLPVATTDRGSLAEVAGDAALCFDPLNEIAIAGAAIRLLSDAYLREQLSAAGREQAARFPWSRTARDTLAVYQDVASAGTTRRG